MSKLSVIIITKNEEDNIRRCLESVKWADEIIVLDSGSTDNTVAICKEYTQNVYLTDWPGYGLQKNRALAKATHSWVLSIDADEEVSNELRKKIKSVIINPSHDAYKIKRPVIFLNKLVKHACGADKTVRLFKRNSAKFSDDIVHETVLVNGTVGLLSQPIYHYSFTDINMLLDKMNKYTSLVANQRLKQKKKSNLFKATTHALWMFIRVYFLQKGFLDGKVGLLLAISFAEGSYYRYVKVLYENVYKCAHDKNKQIIN